MYKCTHLDLFFIHVQKVICVGHYLHLYKIGIHFENLIFQSLNFVDINILMVLLLLIWYEITINKLNIKL
jgi:hypothetical protein